MGGASRPPFSRTAAPPSTHLDDIKAGRARPAHVDHLPGSGTPQRRRLSSCSSLLLASKHSSAWRGTRPPASRQPAGGAAQAGVAAAGGSGWLTMGSTSADSANERIFMGMVALRGGSRDGR